MKKYKLLFIFLAVLISLIGVIPLIKPGFFLTDDGNSMVIRFSAFYEALRSGQFPVRFLSRLNYGFGYPVADFLYPLFMYIGVPIHILGVSFVNTLKIIFFLSFLSGTVFSFLWLRKLFDEKSAFLGSVVYSLFPYHLFDIYKRGSVGEVLALGILPLILWQLERRSLLWASTGLSLLILSHNTLAVLFLIFLVFYSFLDLYISKNSKQLIKYYSAVLIIGLGISSFFSIPAIFDLQYTIFFKTSVSDWSKYFADFSQIGLSTLMIFLTVLFFLIIKKIEIKKHRLTLLMFFVGVISIFLATGISSFVWGILPASFIQFPFRLLSVTIVAASFLSSSMVFVLKDKQKNLLVIFILVLVIFSSKEFFQPKVFQNYPDTFYSTNQDSTTVRNEYMPKWAENVPDKMASQAVEVVKGKSDFKSLVLKGTSIRFDLDSKQRSVIQINKIYFPGWKVVMDGKNIPIFYNNKYGIIQFEVNKGDHSVKAGFGETNVRLVADIISLISIFSLFLILKKNVKFS